MVTGIGPDRRRGADREGSAPQGGAARRCRRRRPRRSWFDVESVGELADGSLAAVASPAATWWSPTSRGRCSPTGTRAPAAARRCTTGELRAGALSCPQVRALVLPPARGTLDGRRRAPARAGPAAARARPREGGACAHERERVAARLRPTRSRPAGARGVVVRAARPGAGARGPTRRANAGAPPPDTRAATCAASAIPEDHRHLLAARRAADRVRVRGVLGDARGRGRLPPDRQPDAVAARASTSPTICGRASRSRSGWRSSWSRRSPRAWSRCIRARPGRPSPSSTSSRGAGCSSSTRCSRGSSPTSRG